MTQAIVDAEAQQAFEQASGRTPGTSSVSQPIFQKGLGEEKYSGGDARDWQPCLRAGLNAENFG